MTQQRIELMKLISDLSPEIKRFQKESLSMQTTDLAIARINNCIVANEQVDEETIKALFNFLTELEKAHQEHVSQAMEDMIDID